MVVEGGWEELFLSKVETVGHSSSFLGSTLTMNQARGRRTRSTKFTNFNRKQIINSLTQHLKLRFCIDESIQIAIKPLAEISTSASEQELKTFHSVMIPDLDEGQFLLQYYQAAEFLRPFECQTALEGLQMLISKCPDKFGIVKSALARCLATKPHSPDVELLISKSSTIIN